jgi:general secretion pathway protein D
MRSGCFILVIALCSAATLAADQSQNLLILPCAQGATTDSACNPSKADIKKARADFSRAMKLQKEKRFAQAYEEFDAAARLSPKNVNYVTALAMVREQLVFDHLQHGNADLLNQKQVEAQAEFRSALNLDPENEFAQQRLRDSLAEWAPKSAPVAVAVEDAGVLSVVPSQAPHDFHFRGDGRALLTQVAAEFGVDAEFDDSVVTHRVHFDLDSVDFLTAMRAACSVTGTFWTPLAEKQIWLARDTSENHRLFDRMALRTFYMPGVTTPEQLTELTTLLRIVFEIRFIGEEHGGGRIVVRAPVAVLGAVTRFFENLEALRPQVMLDVKVFQIDHQLTRNMGVSIPNQFTLFNVPAAAILGLVSGLGGTNIQSLINQLISGGGINQTNSQGISGLLAQLAQQNSPLGQLFSQPVATFGGGLTLMAIQPQPLSGQMSLNESWVKSLDHASLRAAQGSAATFRLGSRYPVVNASFAPVFNTAAISQVLQNGSFQAPFPSFSYEDLGLSIKAKPVVHPNLDVSLDLEMQLRTLAGQSVNGVPVINNREYKGSITLVDGEPALVASALTLNEQRSMTGIPGLGAIPGLNRVMVNNGKTDESDELLIVITPHVLSSKESRDSEVWLPKGY